MESNARKSYLVQRAAEFDAVLKHYGLFEPLDVYKVLCPFHGDKNASLKIDRLKQNFYCFGCGVSGGSLGLVKLFENSDNFIRTKIILNRILTGNTRYDADAGEILGKIARSETDFKSARIQAKDFYFNLPQTNWFKVDEDAAEIKAYMRKRGFSCKTLNECGAKATYGEQYPIVFPMYDNSMFKGYVMRTDKKDVEERRKYFYNKGFRRRTTLAGCYRADTVVLVEGFLDKIAANQLGVKNVAAILGWKITNEQFEKLVNRKVKTVICALDNDECGRKGYKYLLDKSGANFKVARLHYPKGIKDFGDLLKNEEAAEKVLVQLEQLGAE